MGSGLAGGNKNATAVKQIESSLGAAVWTFDFHLYCMSIGVAGISNQVGDAEWNFAPFSPRTVKDVPTAVRPTWYGVVAAADFLGNDTSQATRVAPLNVPNGSQLTAYASFEGDALSKIALLNMQLWDPIIDSKKRPEVTVQVTGLPDGIQTARMKKLTGPGGLARGNVTWGGDSWTYQNRGKPVKAGEGPRTLPVKQGAVGVTVGATEVVMVSFLR